MEAWEGVIYNALCRSNTFREFPDRYFKFALINIAFFRGREKGYGSVSNNFDFFEDFRVISQRNYGP